MTKLLDFISPYLGAIKLGLLAAAALGIAVGSWTARGWLADRDIAALRADIAQKREKAITEARADERKQQENINEALRKQNTAMAGINDRLERDIDRLRQRPERPAGVPETSRPDCTGANGAELGGSHAIFLRRFAARAAQCDAALAACYEAFDGLR